jgi:pimeloyl-ACP methyl ester carboxylesterase
MSALEAATADAAKSGIRFDRVPLNGIRMHYARKGPPNAPKLLLLHGWPEFWMLWRPLFDRLGNEFDLIAPDLRGFGDTGKAQTGPDPGVTAVAHAEDIRAFVEALGLDRFGMVAGDVGSYVAQAYSRRHGKRIAGLVSFNSPYPGFGARYGAPGHLIEVWYQYFNQLPWAAGVIGATRESCRTYLKHFLDHWSGDNPAVFADVLEIWVDNFMKPGNIQGGFDWYLSSAPVRRLWLEERLPPEPPITVPTRMLWGKRDPLAKIEWADRLGEYFADYTIDFVDAGHYVPFELPDLAAEEIRKFFAGRLA